MAQAHRSYYPTGADAWRADRAAPLPMYRCGNCSLEFGLEPTVAGPQCCPACGVIFEPKDELRPEETAAVLARAAQSLDMAPTTLLYLVRMIAIALKALR